LETKERKGENYMKKSKNEMNGYVAYMPMTRSV
jgi:hypothetical protein